MAITPPFGARERVVPGSLGAETAPLGLPDGSGSATISPAECAGKTIAAIANAAAIAIAAGARAQLRLAAITASNNADTLCVTSLGMLMVRPHSRAVSPGHLFVASMPILPPRPLTGEAKSR